MWQETFIAFLFLAYYLYINPITAERDDLDCSSLFNVF